MHVNDIITLDYAYGEELDGRHLGLRRSSQEPLHQKYNFCQEAHLRTL